MKISWGGGIAIFYILFMAVLLFFVIKSTTYDNSLVYEDYYQKDLEYQEHFDRQKNAQALAKDLQIRFENETKLVEFIFPDGMMGINGTIFFYNPTSSTKDFKVTVAPERGLQSVDLSNIQLGRWVIKVEWEGDSTPFYKEKSIYLK